MLKYGLQELLSELTKDTFLMPPPPCPPVPIINDGYYKYTSQIDLNNLSISLIFIDLKILWSIKYYVNGLNR